MSVASPVRAYTQPLDQQDGSPLLHLPSPMFPERKPGAVLAEGLRMSPKKLSDNKRSDNKPAGKTGLAVDDEQPRKLRFSGLVDDIGGRHRL